MRRAQQGRTWCGPLVYPRVGGTLADVSGTAIAPLATRSSPTGAGVPRRTLFAESEVLEQAVPIEADRGG